MAITLKKLCGISYAYADTEQKRKAIEQATTPSNPLKSKLNAERFIITDDDILKRLYGLI